MFEKKKFQLSFINYAPIHVALEQPPGGGLWRVDSVNTKQETGHTTQIYFVASGAQAAVLEYRGATLVGSTPKQRKEEAERLQRIRDAANKALEELRAYAAMLGESV